jgi:hypothetical protein
MQRKIAGKLNQPPAQDEFDTIPLAGLCLPVEGAFYRLHSLNRATWAPWPPLHFSRRGNSRFDAKDGVGALCVAQSLAGALMELFDDHWGPVGSIGRSVTEQTLAETFVTLVSLPKVDLFDATGANLSKIGTDAQLLTGKYSTTRKWASRLMLHPDNIDGVLYLSRHDPGRKNVALFERHHFLPAIWDAGLTANGFSTRTRSAAQAGRLLYGPAVSLRNHRDLMPALIELKVARLP